MDAHRISDRPGGAVDLEQDTTSIWKERTMNIHLYDEDEAPTVVSESEIESSADAVRQATSGDDTPVTDRQGYIGGSDAAVIAGLSPWKTPYELWLEKTGEEAPPDLSANERVYWGQVLEEIVAREYARRTGRKVRRQNKLLRHREYPFIAAHIDRDVLNELRILEVKTTDIGRADEWGEEGSDEIPDHYYCQVQHYLAVTGEAVCDVAVLIGGNRFRIYSVSRDEEFIAGLINLEREFWQHVTERRPPEPKSSDEANQMWPHGGEGRVRAGDQEMMLARELFDVRSRIKELESKRDRLETQLKTAMADIGEELFYGKTKLATWKTQKRRSFDTKAFREANPDLYERYSEEKELRVFRLSWKPGKGE
jgi:putative phage-type endonuclease